MKVRRPLYSYHSSLIPFSVVIISLIFTTFFTGCRNAPEPDVRIHSDAFGKIANEGDTITIWDHSFANVVEISVAKLNLQYDNNNQPYYYAYQYPSLKLDDNSYIGSKKFSDSSNKQYTIKTTYSDEGRSRFDYDTSKRPNIRYVLDYYEFKTGKYIICTKAYNIYTDYGLGVIPLAEGQRKTAERVDTIYVK